MKEWTSYDTEAASHLCSPVYRDMNGISFTAQILSLSQPIRCIVVNTIFWSLQAEEVTSATLVIASPLKHSNLKRASLPVMPCRVAAQPNNVADFWSRGLLLLSKLIILRCLLFNFPYISDQQFFSP